MSERDASVASFETDRVGGVLVVARPEATQWARESIGQHGSLYAAAMEHRILRLEGRGSIPVIRNPSGQGPAWVVRHYRRGGGMRFLGDRFLRTKTLRSLKELDTSVRATAVGITTPRVIAATIHPTGVFYRADLVTEFVSDARELADVLLGTSDASVPPADADTRLQALTCTDRLITKMVTHKLRHPDLNARNILLVRNSQGMEPVLLDLDRCNIGEVGGASDGPRLRQRLVRSINKLQRTRRGEVSDDEMAIILRGDRPS